MRHLAEALMLKFEQHTVCIIDKDNIIMLENELFLTNYKEKVV